MAARPPSSPRFSLIGACPFVLSRHTLLVAAFAVPCYGFLALMLACLRDQVRMPPPGDDDQLQHLQDWDLAA